MGRFVRSGAFGAAIFAILGFVDPPLVQPGAPGQPNKIITQERSREMALGSFTEADVQFMQHMIVHHGQAVDMVALIDGRGSRQDVRQMGERIAISQATEIEFMRRWLLSRGQSTEMQMGDDPHAGHGDAMKMEGPPMGHGKGKHHHHGKTKDSMTDMDDVAIMAGMLSPRQMRELEAARGKKFDYLFLTGMILHHQGAIDMVNALNVTPGAAEDPELSEFMSAVVSDQAAEILRMENMLADF